MSSTPANLPPGPLPGDEGWVDDGRLWTVAELNQLTPDQRDALARQRVQPITDLSGLAPELVARIRATGKRLLEEYRQFGGQ